MSARLRDRQMQRCCDALAAVPPDASTLCEGWTAHDLAVHLWMLNHDPAAWPMIALPPLAGRLRRRMDRVAQRESYAALVERLRRQRGPIRCMPLDRFEDYRHALGEYFVHTQDVVRANGLAQEPPDRELESALWLRARLAARILHRRRTPGLVLATPAGGLAAATHSAPTLVVTGEPSELICWVYGRVEQAEVTVRRAEPGERLPRLGGPRDRPGRWRPWWS